MTPSSTNSFNNTFFTNCYSVIRFNCNWKSFVSDFSLISDEAKKHGPTCKNTSASWLPVILQVPNHLPVEYYLQSHLGYRFKLILSFKEHDINIPQAMAKHFFQTNLMCYLKLNNIVKLNNSVFKLLNLYYWSG